MRDTEARRPGTRACACLIAAVATLALAGCHGDTHVSPTSSSLEENTIHVSGSATVAATPDVARIRLGVQAFDASVVEAVSANNETAAAVIAVVKSLGVEPRDVETTSFAISPQRDYRNDRPDSIIGYWVNNELSVTIRDLTSVGQVLQAAIDAGANTISGIAFSLADPEEAKETARTMAVEDARRRAEVLAEAAGVRVGKVLSIREVSLSAPPIYRGAEMDSASAELVPIESGELEITAQVQVVFAIG